MLSAIDAGKSQGSFPSFSPAMMLRGRLSLLSSVYMCNARPNCLRLFMQLARLAFSLADASAGKSIAARMAMMAMTTSSSMSVKARFDFKEFLKVFISSSGTFGIAEFLQQELRIVNQTVSIGSRRGRVAIICIGGPVPVDRHVDVLGMAVGKGDVSTFAVADGDGVAVVLTDVRLPSTIVQLVDAGGRRLRRQFSRSVVGGLLGEHDFIRRTLDLAKLEF